MRHELYVYSEFYSQSNLIFWDNEVHKIREILGNQIAHDKARDRIVLIYLQHYF